MKIYQKLATGFLTVSFAVFVLGYTVMVVNSRLVDEFHRIAGFLLPGTVAESGVQTSLYRIMVYATQYGITRDPRDRKLINEQLVRLETEVAMHRLYHHDYDIDEHVEVMETLTDRFVSLVTQYLRLVENGADKARIRCARKKALDVLDTFNMKVAPVIEKHLENAFRSMETIRRYERRARVIVLGSSAFVLFLSLVLGFIISHLISRPVMRLTDAARRIGKGDLDTDIDIRSRDEIGVLARTLKDMARELKEITVSRDTFAREVEERRKAQAALRDSEQMLSGVVSSITDSMVLLSEDLEILWVNDRARALIGQDVTGRKCYEALHKRNDPCDPCIVRQCFDDGMIHDCETCFVHAGARKIDIWATANVAATGEDGRPVRVVEFMRDITERKQARDAIKRSLREKEVLLKEIHHRVKNNMQVISSLLRLRASRMVDRRDKEALIESQNQIKSMALVHEKLYQSGDLANIDFKGYVKQLSGDLFRSYGVDPGKIGLRLDVENAGLKIESAIPCGLIISELVSNCIKYAFPGDMKGFISISLRSVDNNGQVRLEVSDDGVGIPDEVDPEGVKSLGLRLVSILVAQLQGTLNVKRESGTTFEIMFNINKNNKNAGSGRGDQPGHEESYDNGSHGI